MFSIIWKLLEWGIDKYSSHKLQTANTQLEREKIEADVQKNKDNVRGMVLGQGAFWFQLFFIIPLALWFSSVTVYSILWCEDCIYAQPWTIAALPEPLDEWSGWIIGFLFLAHVSRR